MKKNGVFLFNISFFILEIFTFLYYANEESDDVIGGSTKTAQHSIENNSGNIKAVFFKLGTSNVQCASQKKQNQKLFSTFSSFLKATKLKMSQPTSSILLKNLIVHLYPNDLP